MKIALVSPYDFAYVGGVAGHISELDKQFQRMGHQVKILAPTSESPEKIGRDNLIPIGRPVPIPASGSLARITVSLRLAPKIKETIARENFDVIHIHEPLMPALPVTVLRVAQGTKIGTFHAFADGKRAYKYWRFILNGWMQRLDGRIAVSEPAHRLISKYFPGDYEIIPNGIDVRHFSTPQAPLAKYQDGKLNIVFVGRINEKRKGLRHLLKAYSRLKWELPNVRLIVVGPGDLDEESARIIAERGLHDVDIVGRVSQERLPAYYQAADVFCSPATGGESFGLVLLEAMAAGRPVLASNIPGYASVLDDGMQGRLINPRDEEEFAGVLYRLLQDPAQRLHMGENGRVKSRRYDWPNVAERVMAYYRYCLEKRARGSRLFPSRALY